MTASTLHECCPRSRPSSLSSSPIDRRPRSQTRPRRIRYPARIAQRDRSVRTGGHGTATARTLCSHGRGPHAEAVPPHRQVSSGGAPRFSWAPTFVHGPVSPQSWAFTIRHYFNRDVRAFAGHAPTKRTLPRASPRRYSARRIAGPEATVVCRMRAARMSRFSKTATSPGRVSSRA